MNILDRYITRVVIQGTLLVLLVLVMLFAFMKLVSEINLIGQGDYDLVDAMVYVGLGIPRSIYDLFPTSVLVGSLLSLGTLASNSELIVMRAAGISVTRIIRSVLQTGLILALMAAVVGEVLVPPSVDKALSIKTLALHRNISVGGANGLWIRDGDVYLNVLQIYPDKRLSGIEIYEFNEQRQLQRITKASSGKYQDNEWFLKNVTRTIFTEGDVTTEKVNSEVWKKLFKPELFTVVAVQPQDMSALDLYHYSQYLENNKLDASAYRLAFWLKLIIPLSSIAMLLIALPFVFGSLRSGSSGQRIIIGIVIGVGFFIANRIMNHFGQVYGLHPLLSASMPLIIVMLVGLIALKKVHQ